MALEAGQAFVDLVPRLHPGFGERAGAMVEAATRPVIERVSRAFMDAGERMRTIGTKMTTFITLPLVAGGVAAFKFASDLNESTSKAQVVFGEMFTGVSKWAAGAAKNLGISRQQALESSATFGNLFRAMGIGLPTAADLSKKIVGLSSDLASFNNANPTEVLEALRAGLVGEIEPLRKFGINLSQARIEAKALEMGLWDGEDAISAGAKAQAAYALIVQDSALAQGDFARTADGAANKQRILTARFKDTAAMIGNRLLPIGQTLMGWVEKLLSGWDKLSPAGQRVALIIAGIAAAAGPLVYVLGAVATLIGFLLSPIGLVIAGIAALAFAATKLGVDWGAVWDWVKNAAVDAWAFIQGTVVPLARRVIGAIGDAIGWIADNAPGWWEAVRGAAETAFGWLERHVFPVMERIVSAFKIGLTIVAAVVLAGVAVIQWLWDTFGEHIVNALKLAWDFIEGIIEAGLSIVKGVLDVFIAIFTLDWSRLWEGVKAIVSGVWDAIVTTISFAIGLFVTAISAGLAFVAAIFSGIWGGITAGVSAAWNAIVSVVVGGINATVGFIASLPGRIVAFVGQILNAGASLGRAVIDGIWNGIKAAAGILADVGTAILNAFKKGWNTVARTINDFIPDKIGFGTPFGFVGVDLPDNPIPTFHRGGIVPGPPGSELLALVQAGEKITPADDVDDDDPRGPGDTLIFYVDRPRDILDELEWRRSTSGVA